MHQNLLLPRPRWKPKAEPVIVEPPEYWTAIANDESLDDEIRFMALIGLVSRHARPGMKLTEFVELFDNPKWLKESDLIDWSRDAMRGWIPIHGDPNDTIFSIRSNQGRYNVFFCVHGKMEVGLPIGLFHGETSLNKRDSFLRIQEIATVVTKEGQDLQWAKVEPR